MSASMLVLILSAAALLLILSHRERPLKMSRTQAYRELWKKEQERRKADA